MMYADKFVAAIKVNGKVLRERGDIVSLPFGCEYSILVKNLHAVRAQIALSIDGQDAVGKIIIAPNSSVELERFVKNGNLDAGNRFKFIERTAEVEAHRGSRADDGIIRIEAHKETRPTTYDPLENLHWPDHWPWPPTRRPTFPPPFRPRYPLHDHNFKKYAGAQARSVSTGVRGQSVNSSRSFIGTQDSVNRNPGITVPGGISNQKFVSVSGFPLHYPATVIVLRLMGSTSAGDPIETPITVDRKPECSVCGKTGSPTADFCERCGASLVLV